jgi:hypothetical protein
MLTDWRPNLQAIRASPAVWVRKDASRSTDFASTAGLHQGGTCSAPPLPGIAADSTVVSEASLDVRSERQYAVAADSVESALTGCMKSTSTLQLDSSKLLSMHPSPRLHLCVTAPFAVCSSAS